VVLVPILWRLIAGIRRKRYPAAAVYLIFLITQAVDFTLSRPKEMVLWGFLLGLAETGFEDSHEEVRVPQPTGSVV
jgi:hypothetical protein